MTDAERRKMAESITKQIVAAATLLDATLQQCQMLRAALAPDTPAVDADGNSSAHGNETPDGAETEPATFGDAAPRRARPPRRPEITT